MKPSSLGKWAAAAVMAGVALGFAGPPADAQVIPSRILAIDTDSTLVEAQYRGRKAWRSGSSYERSYRSPKRFRSHRSFRHRHVRRHSPRISFGFAFAAPFVAAPYYYDYYDHYSPYAYGSPVYTTGLVPGSAAWLDYCSRKYRSFNPVTRLYFSYSGVWRPCRVP